MGEEQKVAEAFNAARAKSDKLFEELIASVAPAAAGKGGSVSCSAGEHCGGGTVKL